MESEGSPFEAKKLRNRKVKYDQDPAGLEESFNFTCKVNTEAALDLSTSLNIVKKCIYFGDNATGHFDIARRWLKVG